MKTQLLFALAALTPCLCDESSATFPKPLILNFYQEDKGSTVLSDITSYQDASKRIDDGISPSSNDPSYLNHLKFTSPDDPKRTIFWQPEGMKSINCDIVVSGDPKAEQVTYHIDSRTFEHEGDPDLSVIHIHCPEDPKANDDQYDDSLSQYYSEEELQLFEMLAQLDDQGDIPDLKSSKLADADYEGVYPRPTAIELNDTDFEHELNVIFQISDQPRYFTTREDAKERKSQLNIDFLWSAIGDGTMTQGEVDYEKYQAGSADRAYRRTWAQANYSDTPPETLVNVTYGASSAALQDTSYTGMSLGAPFPPLAISSAWGGPWFGEVGRMEIWRAQTAPRDFMWTLHDEVETSEVVEKVHVEKRDGDCHFKASYDPHVKVVYVILDGEEPKIKLDANNLGEEKWNGKGDEKAFEVTCDKVIKDMGPEPDIATTRISTEPPSSAQPTEATSTGDTKEGESKTETKDGEPTSSAAT